MTVSSKNINKLIIFDLDGVLVDSRTNMRLSWKEVQTKHKIKQTFNQYSKFIGLPFFEILQNIGISNLRLMIKIKKTYNKSSIENIDKIKFYPGIISTLKYLKKKNYKISIVTSKNYHRTKIIIKKYLNYFDTINTPNSKLPPKPDPSQIYYAISKANSSKKLTTFIGDSIFDKMAAKRAGVNFLYAAYGYGNLNEKIFLKKLTEIKKIV